MNSEKTYSISELAKEFDITPRTIRFYEDQGLINPQRQNQRRIYAERERVLLKLILRGKRLGFTLNEAKELFDLYDPTSGNLKQLQTMLDKIHEKKFTLQQQKHDIEVMQMELQAAEKRVRHALIQAQEKLMQKQQNNPQ